MPPLILILLTITFSFINNELLINSITELNKSILKIFGWLFSWSTFLFLLILGIVYFSPLAKVVIGGKNAQPLLSKWRWFAISICTTIATGILFWGCAEPLYHYASPPAGLQIAQKSAESLAFSMSTMFMHWSFAPYGIYCITALTFALAYYNLKRPFLVSSLFFSGEKSNWGTYSFDVICLYGLVLGMSASLGAGILSIIGGLDYTLGFEKNNYLIAIVGMVIILSFIISAISGLQKGIKWLSSINIIIFIFIAIYVFLMASPTAILQNCFIGLSDYVQNFIPRSVNIGSQLNNDWLNSWTIFYLANWFAWAPVASLFLGRIAKGYTVRDFINFNLIIPSIFAIVWMSIFSGSTLYFNEILNNSLYDLMKTNGEESVMYAVLNELTLGKLVSYLVVFTIFLSYVTAADSNISAMSSISSKEVNAQNGEAPTVIKVIWGVLIGGLTYTMISTKGIDGIRILSVLGGFPAMFVVILASFSLLKFLFFGIKMDE